jgi:hypothetical protein
VEDAATREAKGKTLERLGAKLKPEAQTMFIAGLNYKGFTVRIVAQSRACRVLAQVVAG